MKKDNNIKTILKWSSILLVLFGVLCYILTFFYNFDHPWWLLLYLTIPIIITWEVIKHDKDHSNLTISSIDLFADPGNKWFGFILEALYSIKLIGIGLLIIALAKPQLKKDSWDIKTKEGIDIVIALDVSGSMLAKDFKPDRLEASKEVAQEFIKRRSSDRIGLTIYEGEAFLQCPVTDDHKNLSALFKYAVTGRLTQGTAIGAGLATAVDAMKNSDAKSKVVILLTDGVNMAPGQISPLTATDIAEAMGVRVYTIGVGTNGLALTPTAMIGNKYIYDKLPVKIDEDLLKKIAKRTGGEYFRATDKKKLGEIYNKIDLLEKSKIEVTEFVDIPQRFFPFLALGLLLIAIEFILDSTIFRSIIE